MDASELEVLLGPVLEQQGAELVDLHWRPESGRWTLRLFIDKPGGVTLDDCEYFSNLVGAFLDEGDRIEPSYVLEVSSPGLDRVIKKDRDFDRFSGRAVKVKLRTPLEGRRRYVGVLAGLREGRVELSTEAGPVSFERGSVEEVRLDEAAQIDFGR